MVDVLHVFAPMGKARQTDYGGPIPRGGQDEPRHELVGMIAGYPIDDAGLGMAKRDFPNAKATFVTRAVHHSASKHGAAIYLALWVDSMEAGQALPGFVPIFEYSGGFYVPPPFDGLAFIMPHDQHKGMAIKRVPMAEGFPLPDYDDDGAVTFSLIPLGQIGHQIFLQEDPGHWYLTNADASLKKGMERGDLVAFARHYRETFR